MIGERASWCLCTMGKGIYLCAVHAELLESRERWSLRKLGVDEWLIRRVMALYTETCTVVRTDAGQGESFEVNVGLH